MATHDPFDPSYSDLSSDEQISVCNCWLESNPGNEMRHAVENMSRAARTIKQNETTIKQNETTIKQQATTIEQQATTIKQRSLETLLAKYPNLIDLTESGFYWPTNHMGAAIQEKDISTDMFASVQKLCMSSEDYWQAPYIPPMTENCDSESIVVVAVHALLESVLKGLKLDKVVEVVLNRTLAGAECDVLLVYVPNRLPFAVLEIKKPPTEEKGRNQLFHGKPNNQGTENRVAGEVAAEMKGVQLFGFLKVFGMISTANHWRLVCTGLIEEESDNIDAMKAAWDNLRTLSVDAAEEDSETRNDVSIIDSPEQKEFHYIQENGKGASRMSIHASQIVPNLDDSERVKFSVESAGLQVLQLVTLFILKACTTLIQLLDAVIPVDTLKVHSQMPCRILNEDQQHFAFGSVSLMTLNLDKFNKNLQTIYVIHHIGMGDSGNCCLGVSQSGKSSCVVKFYHQAKSATTIALVKEEYQNWVNIYGKTQHDHWSSICRKPNVLPMSRQFQIIEGHCLVMPYLRPICKRERHQLLDSDRIKKTLESFAKTGYKHLDIKWRHFGRWKEGIFLLDLGKVAKVGAAEAESWVKEAMDMLRKTVGKREANLQRTPNTRKRGAPDVAHQGEAKLQRTRNTRK